MGKDPHRRSSRRRFLSIPVLAIAVLSLAMGMGVLSPPRPHPSGDDLRSQVLGDFYRLQHAVTGYVADTGAFPQAAVDLTKDYTGGLAEKTFVPQAQAAAWKGPYLAPPLARPTGTSFWSLADPCCMNDKDGDGAVDELWARLHRGNGDIDDETAAWLDKVLDDGVADKGAVRVTPTWIWFQLLER